MEAEAQPGSAVAGHRLLDAHWQQYLLLLDEYTTAQAAIQNHVTAGFLSLAQANFRSASSGRRYGQDHYDQRAVATTRVTVGVQPLHHGLSIVKVHVPEVKDDQDKYKDAEDEDDMHEEKEGEEALPKPPTNSHDPIRCFGILVPPTLRTAQKSFSSAVLGEDCVAKAVKAARGMRSIEAQIRRLRKELKRLEKGGDLGRPKASPPGMDEFLAVAEGDDGGV